jgi:hypothetical protein
MDRLVQAQATINHFIWASIQATIRAIIQATIQASIQALVSLTIWGLHHVHQIPSRLYAPITACHCRHVAPVLPSSHPLPSLILHFDSSRLLHLLMSSGSSPNRKLFGEETMQIPTSWEDIFVKPGCWWDPIPFKIKSKWNVLQVKSHFGEHATVYCATRTFLQAFPKKMRRVIVWLPSIGIIGMCGAFGCADFNNALLILRMNLLS